MKKIIATTSVWLVVSLTTATTPGPVQAGVESIFSVATNQYGTAGAGATVLQQGVYNTRHGIEPFSAPFVSGFLGLNALAVDGDSIYFSVVDRGQEYFGSSTPTLLEATCGYRYDVGSGTVTPLNDWTTLGLEVGKLDGLDILWDGSITFSTETTTHVLQDGAMYPIRQENIYRFDPSTAKFQMFFDGEAFGLSALDAMDVLENGRVVFSTPANQFVLTPQGGVVLRHQNAYQVRDAGNLERVLDGQAMQLQTLDAVDLDVSILAIDEDLIHWSVLSTTSGRYDLVRGDLFELYRTRGDFELSTLDCLATGQVEKSLLYPSDPAPGEGFWFVMRETGETYDSNAQTQVGSRDVGIAASGAGCP